MQQNASAKIVLLIVGIAVIVIGGLVYYAMQMADRTETAEPEPQNNGEQISGAGAADVEADLQGMDLEGLDAELGDMEKEIAQ